VGGYDLVVVGGGPGGYAGAVYAADRGYKVALVEEHYLGGECTNYGCIPSKALLASVKPFLEERLLGDGAGPRGVSPSRVFARALGVAREVRRGIESLLDSSGVSVFEGHGRLYPGRVETGESVFEWSKGVLLASGSTPFVPDSWRVSDRVVDNRGILSVGGSLSGTLDIIVVGGGAVGVEYAQVLAGLGFNVTLVEALGRLLPSLDRELGATVRRLLSRLGVRVRVGSPVLGVKGDGERVRVGLRGEILEADYVLVAIGRKPRADEAIRAGAKVSDRGFIVHDGCGRTSVGWLWTAGDAAGPPLLAHKAMLESKNAVRCMLGGSPAQPPIPVVVYGLVDVVSVGLTYDEALEAGYRAAEARVGASWNAISRVHGLREGLVKIVYDEASGRVLGIHMAFPGAAEAAGEASLAVAKGLEVHDLADALHPHPTAVEVLAEAAEAILGEAIHVRGVRVRRPRS